jgi:hypothetical protein
LARRDSRDDGPGTFGKTAENVAVPANHAGSHARDKVAEQQSGDDDLNSGKATLPGNGAGQGAMMASRRVTSSPAIWSASFLEGVADGILGTADRALDLAGGFFCGTLGLGLLVAGHFAYGLLDGTLDLLGDAIDAILIHVVLLLSAAP